MSIHICWIVIAAVWVIAIAGSYISVTEDRSSFGMGGCLTTLVLLALAIVTTLSMVLFHLVNCIGLRT